jgi:hypothetical protein
MATALHNQPTMDQRQLSRNLAAIRYVFGQHDRSSQQAAMEVSMSHRKMVKEDAEQKEKEASLTYGEVTPAEFMKMLNTYEQLSIGQVKKRCAGISTMKSRIFVDLGSGRGLPSICAALSPIGFVEVLGIEIIPELVDMANKLKEDIQVQLSCTELPPKKVLHAKKSQNHANKRLIDYIIIYIQSFEDSYTVSLEILANVMCKQLGHKHYRALLKGHKTLRRYLLTFPDVIQLINEENEIQLLESAATCCTGIIQPASEDIVESVPIPTLPSATIPPVALPTVHFICADIFEVEWWKDADVVYAASLLFSEPMMLRLTACALRLKPGAWLLSLQPLLLSLQEQDMMVLRHDSFFRMSWQMAKVYFYERIAAPGADAL